MDETNGNDNGRRMPWPVRIALVASRWFAAFSTPKNLV